MESFLKVGVISSVHGVHGQVKVFPTTDDAKRFKKLKYVYFLINNEYKKVEIKGVQFFKQMVIVKFEGYDTPEEMQKFRGTELYVDRENAVKLEKNEYFIADLIDMKAVSEDGKYEGVINDVYQTGANDVYEILLSDGNTVLIPAIKECILSIDTASGLLRFRMMDGLID